MKRYFVIIFALLIINPLFAQDFTYFNKKLPVGNTPYPMSVIQTIEEGYFTVSPFEIGGIKVLFWASFDFNGEKIHTGALDRDERIPITDMNGDALLRHSTNNKLYLAYTKHKLNNTEDTDFALLCFEIAGETIFKKEYSTAQKETPTFLVEVENGNLLMGGLQNPDGNAKYYLVKVDEKGEVLWENTFGTNVTGEPSLVFDNGDYLLFGSVNTAKNGQDMFLTSINAEGKANWTKNYGKKTNEIGQQVGLLPEKGYLLAGMIEDGENQKHLYIVVDKKGSVLTEKNYSVSGIGNLQTQLLPVLEGKGFVGIANYTNEEDFIQPLILRIDDNAEVLWSISSLTPTTKANVIAKDIEIGQNEKGYVLTGYSEGKKPYGWVASFDFTGVHCSSFPCDSTDVVTKIKNINTKTTIEVHPNPSKKSYKIQYSFPEISDKNPNFILYNLKGEQVKNFALDVEKEAMTMETSDLPSGMYFYTSLYRGIKVASGKLIVK